MNVLGSDGESLKDKWDREVATHLGMTCNGFPNMYFNSCALMLSYDLYSPYSGSLYMVLKLPLHLPTGRHAP